MVFYADIVFFDAKNGGRRSPGFQGYRPMVRFPDSTMLSFARINFVTPDGRPYEMGARVPGAVVAEMCIPNDDPSAAILQTGTTFELTEGTHAIARGTITGDVRTVDFDWEFVRPPFRLVDEYDVSASDESTG
jgi:translation elongation factor EF-Tu-like GTPase